MNSHKDDFAKEHRDVPRENIQRFEILGLGSLVGLD